MLGWISVFALMLLCGMVAVIGDVGATLSLTSSVVFGFLLVISALTLVLRGQA